MTQYYDRNYPRANPARPVQGPAGNFDDPTSRRKFLRAAVVGTAGVAGAAGVAGVVLARSGGGSKPGFLNIGVYTALSGATLVACFEDTNYTDVPEIGGSSGYNYSQSYFAVLGISDLPAGTYTIQVQQEVDSHGFKNIEPKGSGTSTAPFGYQSSGDNALFYYETAGSIGTTCPYSKGSTSNASADTVPATFTTSKKQDVLLFLHLKWYASKPSSSEPVTFKFSIYQGIGTGGTLLATSTVSITAAP